MSYARLLAATMLFSSLAFSQQVTSSPTGPTLSSHASASAQVAAAPWKVLANQPATESGTDPMDHMRVNQFRIDRNTLPLPGTALRAQPGDDTICYVISSYVVARDSKDSDAVHLVHHSTCQPSSRYRVKTVQLESGSPRP